MNSRFALAILFVAVANLTACTRAQSVQGSYATPSKRVEGTVVNIATSAAIVPLGITTVATSSSGVVGNIVGGVMSRHRLMNTIAEHGVQVISQGDKVRIILSADRFFIQDTPTLKPKNYPTLDFIAALLKEYGRTKIVIAGYTDHVASTEYNQTLSQHQAESVLGYLWVHGVEYQHLHAKGYGPNYPVANEENVKGSAANRRVEITFRDGCCE